MSKTFRDHPLYPRVAEVYFRNLDPALVKAADVTWEQFADGVARGTYLDRATVNSLFVSPTLTDESREHYPHLAAAQQEVFEYLSLWQHAKFHPRFREYAPFLPVRGAERERVAAACFDFASAGWGSFTVNEARKRGYSWADMAEAARSGVALEYLSELNAP